MIACVVVVVKNNFLDHKIRRLGVGEGGGG